MLFPILVCTMIHNIAFIKTFMCTCMYLRMHACDLCSWSARLLWASQNKVVFLFMVSVGVVGMKFPRNCLSIGYGLVSICTLVYTYVYTYVYTNMCVSLSLPYPLMLSVYTAACPSSALMYCTYFCLLENFTLLPPSVIVYPAISESNNKCNLLVICMLKYTVYWLVHLCIGSIKCASAINNIIIAIVLSIIVI